jgi:hypothetical protein
MISFQVVRSRLETELSNIGTLQDELDVKKLLNSDVARKEKLSDHFITRAVGSVLHDFYTSVENMFKTIARYVDKSMPEGSEWHMDILQQMALDIDGIRGRVISIETRDLLNEFRGFRHVFRNIYGFNLVCERIERLLDIFPETVNMLKFDIKSFIEAMNEALEE